MIPQTGYSVTAFEGRQIEAWCREYAVKTVLEFGPGYSTNFFLSAGCRLVCLECDPHWADHFQHFPEASEVQLLHFSERQFPLEIPGLSDATFDLAFIDAPQGGVFPCSRINTALFAWLRCRYLLLHDTSRAGERLTRTILLALGGLVVAENLCEKGLTLMRTNVESVGTMVPSQVGQVGAPPQPHWRAP